MQAVIVSFDSFAASSLGCYGNEWVETPNWDRLATTGIVFDHHFADTVGPSVCAAWISGRHALASGQGASGVLGERLKAAGVATRLIVAGETAPWQRNAGFDLVEVGLGQQGSEVSPDQVPFAQLVRAGLESWNENSFQGTNRLLWLHAPGPGAPPQGFESLYFEDFEERGFRFDTLSPADQADHPAVYAGAVSLIDHWLGELIEGVFPVSPWEPTLLIVTAACGRSWPRLNSYRWNQSTPELYSLCDLKIRAPLVMKVSGAEDQKEFSCHRVRRLAQTCDLTPTLLEWFGISPVDGEQQQAGRSWLGELDDRLPTRTSLWVGDETRFQAIRTLDWLFIQDQQRQPQTESQLSEHAASCALFVKPDDYWDVNDVAGQQPEIVDQLRQLIPRFGS